MAYSFISYKQFRSALAQRLYDANSNLFTDAELKLYSLEALQTFNALANFYRQEFVFNTRQNVTWYDLTDRINLPNTLRPLTVTALSLINAIEYQILEPLTASYPLVWSGSNQFSVSDILNALQQVQDQLLSESNCTMSESLIAAVPGRTTLSGNVLNLRRVCWLPVANSGFTANVVMPSDIWADQSFDASHPPFGYPLGYRRTTSPPITFDVDIQPAVNGQYDILTVNAGATLLASTGSTLSVPNDWCWITKWGALGQLLNRESLASDPLRAQYGSRRFKAGSAAIQTAPALLAARINDQPVIVEAISSGDFYDANWQGKAANAPTSIYYAGLNMLAASPKPDAGPYWVTASVVRNMVLPSLDTDFLQIGQDDIQSILDYAQHIAMFKVGGSEFLATGPLYESFMRHCALYNSKLSGMSIFREFIDLRSQEDERIHPTFTTPTPATVK